MKSQPVIGQGSPDRLLTEADLRGLAAEAFSLWNLAGRRVLVIIPDGTRTAPVPFFFRLFHELLEGKAAALDYLVALGTHPPMSEGALNRLVGITPEEREGRFSRVGLFNHRWDLPETFAVLGTISSAETLALSGGMLSMELPVRINRLVLDYDVIVVCGPVFPHEVAGFSGGSKYFSPGISGPEIINFTHWLGALVTCHDIIGVKQTPVRAVIERVADFIPRPRLYFNLVVKSEGICGLYIGDPRASWPAAAGLSAQVHIRYVERPYRQVLSVMPGMYDDIWTAAKGMYKLEPVVEDGGELIIYAPHITEISYTHGKLIDEIGYHVRDYFVEQWERYKGYPWGVLAHSTHLRGAGSFLDGVERPRIRVTLATGIPEERCARLCLGYRDPASIRPGEWAGREDQGALLVPKAGEILYRLKPKFGEPQAHGNTNTQIRPQ